MSSNDAPQEEPESAGYRRLFLTEPIPPGRYEVHAEGYAPVTPKQERSTGTVTATLSAQATVTVPESRVVPSLKLELKKVTPPAKRLGKTDYGFGGKPSCKHRSKRPRTRRSFAKPIRA